MLRRWTRGGHLQAEVSNKLNEWFEAGLQEWDFSRDAPYFGFEIPDATGKYFYVWLDAPIGYMASFKAYCERSGVSFVEFWRLVRRAELFFFFGFVFVFFFVLF